jgi:hypothetical protein
MVRPQLKKPNKLKRKNRSKGLTIVSSREGGGKKGKEHGAGTQEKTQGDTRVVTCWH